MVVLSGFDSGFWWFFVGLPVFNTTGTLFGLWSILRA